jgi:DNA-binding MarR family transcriptional regulator
LKHLQDNGYVVAERGAVEHRVKLLRLTPKGARMERTASDHERAAMEGALGDVSSSGQKAWRDVMTALAKQA